MTSWTRPLKMKKQQGVAVVTALLLTTLAVTIVASLFWQQQVQVRSIENQRLHAQKKWVSRAVLSFTRLAVNLGTRGNYINTDQPWAQPVKDFRLSDFMAAGYRESADINPSLSGKMEDAQGRFNLTNLIVGNNIDAGELATFERVLQNLQLQKTLAKNVANFILESVPVSVQTGPQGGINTTSTNTVTTVQSLRLTQVEDLAVVPGFTPEILKKLLPHVAILPISTKVNLNTATPEVLAAESKLTVQQAIAVRSSRKYFLSTTEFQTSAQAVSPIPVNTAPLSTVSDFFYVTGVVTLEHARWTVIALIQKTGGPSQSQTQIVWARED